MRRRREEAGVQQGEVHPQVAAALALGVAACAAAPTTSPPVDAPNSELSDPAGSSITQAERDLEERIRGVVVKERPRLRACYEDGLAKNPELEGRVVLVVDVAQNGMAAKVFEARREGLGDAEVRCFANVLKAAHFHDGAARAVRIQVPLAFSKKDGS